MTTGTTVPDSGPESSEPAPGVAKPRRRWPLVGAAAVLVLVAAAGVVVVDRDPFGLFGGWFGGEAEARAEAGNASGTALATVTEGPLSSQVSGSGTLSYAAGDDGSPYSVVSQTPGTYTSLPSAGAMIDCGEAIYRVDDTPVVLLCGKTPAYRDLSEGDEGRDVRVLNKNLVRLGYADRSELDPSSDDFGSETAEAVERLQDDLGVDETGTLRLGDAVFLPGPLLIAEVPAKLGTRAGPGAEVARATSDEREVAVDLDASQQSQVEVGDDAQVILPNNETTPGVVDRIGTVASSSGGEAGSSSAAGADSSTATVPVYITLEQPKDAKGLDQAPVQVQITTDGVKNTLIVPVTALVGRPGGGYATETVGAEGGRRLVPVTLGLFDHANGMVQVSGDLSAGDRVVVPAS